MNDYQSKLDLKSPNPAYGLKKKNSMLTYSLNGWYDDMTPFVILLFSCDSDPCTLCNSIDYQETLLSSNSAPRISWFCWVNWFWQRFSIFSECSLESGLEMDPYGNGSIVFFKAWLMDNAFHYFRFNPVYQGFSFPDMIDDSRQCASHVSTDVISMFICIGIYLHSSHLAERCPLVAICSKPVSF